MRFRIACVILGLVIAYASRAQQQSCCYDSYCVLEPPDCVLSKTDSIVVQSLQASQSFHLIFGLGFDGDYLVHVNDSVVTTRSMRTNESIDAVEGTTRVTRIGVTTQVTIEDQESGRMLDFVMPLDFTYCRVDRRAAGTWLITPTNCPPHAK